MPAMVLNRELPTLYLDWSHLCAAFRSTVDPDYSEWSPLRPILSDGIANVCVSAVHLVELLSWPDKARGSAAAAWLDTLPLVWMRSASDGLELFEAKHALLRALGADLPPYLPFFGSFVQMFADELNPDDVAAMLARPTVSACFADNRERDMRSLRAMSVLLAHDLSIDRKKALSEGFTDAEIAEVFAAAGPYNFEKFLARAHQALRAEDGYRGLGLPSEVELRQAMRRILADPRSLPAVRATSAAMNNFALRVRRQDPASKKFSKHESAWLDLVHCGAGAAYCDVFTCDALTAEHLGEFRVQMSRQPQLAEQQIGTVSAFIRAIDDQIAAAR